jgi:hypothetical protein
MRRQLPRSTKRGTRIITMRPQEIQQPRVGADATPVRGSDTGRRRARSALKSRLEATPNQVAR